MQAEPSQGIDDVVGGLAGQVGEDDISGGCREASRITASALTPPSSRNTCTTSSVSSAGENMRTCNMR